MKNSALLLVLFLGGALTTAQDLTVLQAPVQNIVAQNRDATFTCSVRGELMWEFITIGFTLNDTTSVEFLQTQGVFLVNTTRSRGVETSTIIVNASPITRNGTDIGCGVTGPGITHRVEFLFFGPPATASTAVKAVPVADLHLFLSWEAPFVPFNVTLSYEVNITNQASGNTTTVRTAITTYNFVGGERSCNIHSFVVAAINDAGRGPPSDSVNTSLPTLPDASRITVAHTFELIANEFTCWLEFMPAVSCPDWPVLNYTVVLVDNSTGLQAEHGPFFEAGDRVRIALNSTHNVTENNRYTYHIRTRNAVGSGDSQQFSFFSTDVQRPVFAVDGNTITVRCAFIANSRARGCVAELRLNSTVVATANATRENISGLDVAVVSLTTSGGGSPEVVVYDWEEDGSRGELAIPVPPCREALAICFPENAPPTLGIQSGLLQTEYLKTSSDSAAMVGGVVAGVLLVVVLIGTMFIVILLLTRRKRKITTTINKRRRTGDYLDRDSSLERYGSSKSSAPHTQQVYPKTYPHHSPTSHSLTDPPPYRPPPPIKEDINESSLSTSLEKGGGGSTSPPPFYDLPENLHVKQASTVEVQYCSTDYQHLEHSLPCPPSPLSPPSPPSQSSQPSTHNDTNGGDYSQLGQSRIYAVLERSSEPSPISPNSNSSGGHAPNIHQYSPQRGAAQGELPPEYCEINDVTPYRPRPPTTGPPPSAGTTVL